MEGKVDDVVWLSREKMKHFAEGKGQRVTHLLTKSTHCSKKKRGLIKKRKT